MHEIRYAAVEDTPHIIALIKELAVYEKLENEVKIDENTFKKHVFEDEFCKVLVVVDSGQIIAQALFFHTFSTFLGKAGIYLEDIYVKPNHRGKGIGTALIKHLAKICNDEGFGRLEWECLDWNEPSIEFYKNLGAKQMSGWYKFRLSGDELKNI